MSTESTEKSIFAKTFGDLIEATDIGVDRWAIRLGVEKDDLKDWLNDDGVPPARVIRSFYIQIMDRREPIEKEQKQRRAFMEMLEMRSWESCARGEGRIKMHPAVGYYMLSGLRQSLCDALAGVSPETAIDILCQGIRRCNAERPE